MDVELSQWSGRSSIAQMSAIHLAHVHTAYIFLGPHYLSICSTTMVRSLRNDGHWKLNVASEQVDYHCEIANDHCDPQIGWRRSEMKNIVAKRKPTSFILLDRTVIDFSLSLSFFFLNDKSKSDTLKMYFFFLLNFY